MLRVSISTIAVLLLVMSFAIVLPQAQNRTPLVKGSFTVEPRTFKSTRFEISQNTQVTGRFRAEGGNGNDIEVYIVDEDGFENYRNGHAVQTYYNSGRVTVSRINIRLNEGVYYIIFNNQFSSFTNKVVTADIDLVSGSRPMNANYYGNGNR